MWFRDIFRRVRAGPRAGPVAEADGGVASLTDAAFLRRLNRLAMAASRRLRGQAIGQRPSWRRLPSSDFRDHRLYLEGDDLRHVDWNASARSEHVFVKLGEQPREAMIHVLLDNSASMDWGKPSKLWAARRLAAAIGYLALAHGDRLTVSALAGTVGRPGPTQRLGPAHGTGQVPRLLRFMRDVPIVPRADALAGARWLAARHPRGGCVVLISDLLAVPDFQALCAALPAPAWQLIVLHLLHPAELDPSLTGEIEFQDVETGERANYDLDANALERYRAFVHGWCERFEQTCSERRVTYARVLADWPVEQAIIPYLRRRGVVEPA
jgi:uncharacterized protein (DUF58 family)